jgi:hypothetical protein
MANELTGGSIASHHLVYDFEKIYRLQAEAAV